MRIFFSPDTNEKPSDPPPRPFSPRNDLILNFFAKFKIFVPKFKSLALELQVVAMVSNIRDKFQIKLSFLPPQTSRFVHEKFPTPLITPPPYRCW